MLPWALDPPPGCKVSRKSQTTVHQPVSAAQRSIICLFSLLDITWKCKGNMQANRELTSTLYPNLFSLTSLAVCQRSCEVASRRRLPPVCRVGCLQVLLHTQRLLHLTWMLSYVTQNTERKFSSLISETELEKAVVLLLPIHHLPLTYTNKLPCSTNLSYHHWIV